jgi:hypothetical protein
LKRLQEPQREQGRSPVSARRANSLASFLALIAVGHIKPYPKHQRKAAHDAWYGGSAVGYRWRFRRANLLLGAENKRQLNENQQRPSAIKCPAVKFSELHLIPSECCHCSHIPQRLKAKMLEFNFSTVSDKVFLRFPYRKDLIVGMHARDYLHFIILLLKPHNG